MAALQSLIEALDCWMRKGSEWISTFARSVSSVTLRWFAAPEMQDQNRFTGMTEMPISSGAH